MSSRGGIAGLRGVQGYQCSYYILWRTEEKSIVVFWCAVASALVLGAGFFGGGACGGRVRRDVLCFRGAVFGNDGDGCGDDGYEFVRVAVGRHVEFEIHCDGLLSS